MGLEAVRAAGALLRLLLRAIVLLKWYPNVLLTVEFSFSSLVEAFSIDPARCEVDINEQLQNNYCGSSVRDVVIALGGQHCLVSNSDTPFTFSNPSTQLDASSFQRFPWLSEVID